MLGCTWTEPLCALLFRAHRRSAREQAGHCERCTTTRSPAVTLRPSYSAGLIGFVENKRKKKKNEDIHGKQQSCGKHSLVSKLRIRGETRVASSPLSFGATLKDLDEQGAARSRLLLCLGLWGFRAAQLRRLEVVKDGTQAM